MFREPNSDAASATVRCLPSNAWYISWPVAGSTPTQIGIVWIPIGLPMYMEVVPNPGISIPSYFISP